MMDERHGTDPSGIGYNPPVPGGGVSVTENISSGSTRE